MTSSFAERRARFRRLHERGRLFVMPNPWDVGSARLLHSCGFEAIATTSAGFAWSIGKLDQQVARDELVAHVAQLAAATPLPLNVDTERGFPNDSGGVAETVSLLAEAGAAGLSIEDYDPSTGTLDDVDIAAERIAAAAEAARRLPEPLVLTGRAENFIRDRPDLNDAVARLCAYREAGADVVYAPGLSDIADVARLVRDVDAPVNVLALAGGPSISELAAAGVRRVSTGSLLTRTAYGALLRGARELLDRGTSHYADDGLSSEDLAAAFSEPPPATAA